MHDLKASEFWRMTFTELGEWMWGVGPYWNIRGLGGKVKKKLCREFTNLTTHLIKDIYTDETGVSIDVRLRENDKEYVARLVYYRTESEYELREIELFPIVQKQGGKPINISLDSPDKTVIGKCLANLIK